MTDYIKRDDTINAIESLPTWWADEGGYYGGMQQPRVALLEPEDVINAIKNIPSADVAEVKHARWVRRKHHVGMGITIPIIECSLCGAITPVTEVERWNYCIGCGARMDGGT